MRPGVDEISDFLVAHVANLRVRASDGTAANATFVDLRSRQLLEDLRTGDDATFLAASKTLGDQLVDAMNPLGAAKSGLLVCVTFHDDSTPPVATAAVLKLEVVVPTGAVLERLESGEETLAAVKNVLDKPGELQKGLVFPDSRAGSEAVVGDKAAHQEARYFLTATGITLEAHARGSAKELVRTVSQIAGPRAARKAARAIASVPSGTPREVVEALRSSVPELTADVASDVEAALAAADRPVVAVDTSAPISGSIQAGRLKISGPAEEISQIDWAPRVEGGYEITIHSDQEPKLTWS